LNLHRNRQAGFTLIEMLIIIAIIGILLIVVSSAIVPWKRGSGAYAEKEFGSFAQKLGWNVAGVSCTEIDSDGDGYISCAASVREEGHLIDKAVECASGAWALPWNKTRGCKFALPHMYTGGGGNH
jgi:prepilin-type N-terminal cleavage/methylation domain-containing protein